MKPGLNKAAIIYSAANHKRIRQELLDDEYTRGDEQQASAKSEWTTKR